MKAFKEVTTTEFNPNLIGKVIKFKENSWTESRLGIVRAVERGLMTVVGTYGAHELVAPKIVASGGFIKVLETREEDDDATN